MRSGALNSWTLSPQLQLLLPSSSPWWWYCYTCHGGGMRIIHADVVAVPSILVGRRCKVEVRTVATWKVLRRLVYLRRRPWCRGSCCRGVDLASRWHHGGGSCRHRRSADVVRCAALPVPSEWNVPGRAPRRAWCRNSAVGPRSDGSPLHRSGARSSDLPRILGAAAAAAAASCGGGERSVARFSPQGRRRPRPLCTTKQGHACSIAFVNQGLNSLTPLSFLYALASYFATLLWLLCSGYFENPFCMNSCDPAG